MLEQIELLEHHSDVLTELVNFGLRVSEVHARYDDLAARRRLEAIQAAQKRTLAAPRGADDDDHLTFVHVIGDSF